MLLNLGKYTKAVTCAFAVAGIIVANHLGGNSIWYLDLAGVGAVLGVWALPNKPAI